MNIYDFLRGVLFRGEEQSLKRHTVVGLISVAEFTDHRTGPPGYMGRLAGTTTLHRSRLYPPVRDL